MTKAKATAVPKAFEGEAHPDAFRLLDAGGALIEDAVAPLGGDRLLEGFRWMLFSRALDERAMVGVYLVGPLVSELAAEAALAVEMGASPEDIAGTIHPHPTISESLHEAALMLVGRPLHVAASANIRTN